MKFLFVFFTLCVLYQMVVADRMVSKTCQTGGNTRSEDRVSIKSGQHILQNYCQDGRNNQEKCDMFCMKECKSRSGGCGNGGSLRPDSRHCYCEAPYSG
uniref:FS-H/FSI antigen family member 3 n=1 Tax=Ctenocephalides felis TaxID=7515 RepID=I3VPE4_CTEFE